MTVDTSAAWIDGLITWHESEAHAWRSDGANNGLAVMHRASAATLRALRAERDAARRLAVAGDDLLRECRAVLEPLIAERDTAQADARRLREAVRAFVAWLEHDDSLPDYGALTRDTHPEGESIWREWWERGLRLCDLAQDMGKAALAQGGAG